MLTSPFSIALFSSFCLGSSSKYLYTLFTGMVSYNGILRYSGKFFMFFYRLLIFFKIIFFKKNF